MGRRRADARSDGGATVAVIEDGSRRRAGSDDRVGEPRVGERNETKRIIHCVDLDLVNPLVLSDDEDDDQAFIVVNNHAMVRLCRFYEQLGVDKQTELCQTVYKLVTGRRDDLCSFVDDEKTFGPDTKLVYRHFATLYFCILSDRSESELAMLDLIQVYVETLDRVFENVCELDLIFNSPKAYTVLDETIVGGLVLEINSQKILGVYDNLMKLEKANSSIVDKLV